MTASPSCQCGGETNPRRRRLLFATSAAAAAAGIVAAVPMIANFSSSEMQAGGEPVEVDLSRLLPGEMMTVEWHGKPVWIVHRTPDMLTRLNAVETKLADPYSKQSLQPAYAANAQRSIRPEFFVAIGICTHQGCAPAEKFQPGSAQGMAPGWDGGFLCPCHGSQFDLAGRVLKNMPAPTNLAIPPHHFLADNRLRIGADRKPA